MMSKRRNAALGHCLTGLSAAACLLASAVLVNAATITVTTTEDQYGAGAECSLREAVQAANDNAAFGGCPAGESAAVDVIKVPAGLHRLTLGGAGENGNAEGDLDVTESVRIVGLGANLRWKPPFDWSEWNQDEHFPVETYVARKVLKSLGLDGLESATRDLGDTDALYAQYVTDEATVIANGIGDSATVGDGDRIFDIGDDGIDLTLRNVAIIDGDVGCTGADCRTGAGAINQTGDGKLDLKRVFIADNQSTCFGEGCGGSDTLSFINVNPQSPGGIAAIGGGALAVKQSVLLRNRSVCSDADCDTGHSAISQGALLLDELQLSLAPVTIRNTAIVANETDCVAGLENCYAGKTVDLNSDQDFTANNVWFIGNKNTCSGFRCRSSDVFQWLSSFDKGIAVSLSGLVFADNENYCQGENCSADETADLAGGDATGTVNLSQMLFLGNSNICAGDECDTDEIFDASESLGAYDVSALFFVKNTLDCTGSPCDTDPIYDMDGVSLAGDAVVFHRNNVRCGGECGEVSIWEVDSSDTVVSSFLVSKNRLDSDEPLDGFQIVNIGAEESHLLKDGLVANNRIASSSRPFGAAPNTVVRIGDAKAVLRRLTVIDNQTDGVGGAVAAGIDREGGSAPADVKIVNSEITGNTADEVGGGIFNASTLMLRINRTKITGNTAGEFSGGIFNAEETTLKISGSEITGNIAGTAGGGILNAGTITEITDTTISGNTPDDCVDCP